MKTISDLSDDLLGEILSRVPITSLTVLRSTCRRWNELSKTQVFGKKAAKNQQFLGFILVNYKVCSLRFNLQGICNTEELFIDSSVKKIHELKHVSISRISQCDGLLLCVADVTKDHWLLIWNPYLGQTRWIRPNRNTVMKYSSYVLGYDDSKYNRNHKILRFLYNSVEAKDKYQIEVYDFSSDSWRVLDVNPDWEEPCHHSGVSLKGNTYFLGRKVRYIEHHLLCFDFTTERFGQRLPLPFKRLDYTFADVALSCVRDDKLVLLYSNHPSIFDLDLDFQTIKIWISNKIESDSISWNVFFKVDGSNIPRDVPHDIISFFIDEEKKVAVLCLKRAYEKDKRRLFIIGEDRFVKYVNIGEGMKNHWDYSNLLNSSYVSSLVELKVNTP